MYNPEPRERMESLAEKVGVSVTVSPDIQSINPRDSEPLGVLVFKPSHWLDSHLAGCDIIQAEDYDNGEDSIALMSEHYFKGCELDRADYHVFELHSYDFATTTLDTNPVVGFSAQAYVVGFAAVPKADFKGDNSRADAEYALGLNLSKLYRWCGRMVNQLVIQKPNGEQLARFGDSYNSTELYDKAFSALQEYEKDMIIQ